MAVTKLPAALVQQVWGIDLWEDFLRKLFFNRFTGTTSDNIVHKLTNLSKEKGDTIHIPMRRALQEVALMGDRGADNSHFYLEGNEEEMKLFEFPIVVDIMRNAVDLAGNMEEQKTAIRMRSEAKTALSDWLAQFVDMMCFANLAGFKVKPAIVKKGSNMYDFASSYVPGRAYHASRIVNAAGAGKTVDDITDANKMTLALISQAKRKALNTLGSPIIRPINIDGTQVYVALITPWQARDLRSDPNWLDAMKYAEVRGKENPFFTGSLGYWDGVAMFEHQSVFTVKNSKEIGVGYASLVGAQALGFAVAQETTWKEKEFDYGNQYGISTGTILGIDRPQFNGVDFGAMQILTSSKADI